MKTILTFAIRRLRNPELRSFGRCTQRILQANFVSHMPKRAAAFIAAVESFCLMMNAQKPALTNLTQLDASRDAAWRAFALQVRASLSHPRDVVSDAARQIAAILDKTESPTARPYDESFGIIDGFIAQVDQLPASVLTDAQADEHYARLKETFQTFADARYENAQTKSTQVQGQVRSARTALLQSYDQLVQMLEVYADDDPAAEAVIAHLNEVITPAKALLQRRTRSTQSQDEEEPQTTSHGDTISFDPDDDDPS